MIRLLAVVACCRLMLVGWVVVCLLSAPAVYGSEATLLVSPPAVQLRGNFSRAQLVVTERDATGRVHDRSADLTSSASYVSSNEQVVAVSPAGQLLAKGNGHATIHVNSGMASIEVPVAVSEVSEHPQIGFLDQIAPIINKAGCNMGACHAAQHGKGGFKLSVFGFDPMADWDAIARHNQQRRISLIAPDESLLLQKPTMRVPHGGKRRLDRTSVDYEVIKAWIAGGATRPKPEAATVARIAVTPWRRVGQPGLTQQLRVEATYSDGTLRDVTHWARFDSMDDAVIKVSPSGFVNAVGRGQTPVMVRYEGQAEIAMFVLPFHTGLEIAAWQNNNFMDELALAKFRELGIEPSPLCDDETFVRRAFLDSIGTLPTVEDTFAFVNAMEPDKRERLVDRLLGLTGDPALDIYNDQYAAFWTLKWADLVRNSSRAVGEQGMWSFHNWIRESLRTNKPFDRFVREMVTAKGSVFSSGPANYFRINANSTDLTEAVAQTFLGVRMECAKCHHHPFEKYSQDDYYGLAAFFARVGSKNTEEFGLFGGDRVVIVNPSGEVSHPRTGKKMEPTPLDAPAIDHPLDRRIPLADWLTSPQNEPFAHAVVNRYMSYLLGRGLVEPVDDMRSTNPPSNVQLMNALAKDFVASGYNLKHLIRTIMVSRLYQLDSAPTSSNAADEKFYSHYRVKRLTAEPLLDAIDRVTESATKFKNLPLGTRAIDLPDSQYPDYFLTVFAKPIRATVCECERTPEESLAQALHTLNGDILATKISAKEGRVARLVASGKPHEAIVEELYMAALNRRPSADELTASHAFLTESPSPQECYEDILWALINSKQFLFVR